MGEMCVFIYLYMSKYVTYYDVTRIDSSHVFPWMPSCHNALITMLGSLGRWGQWVEEIMKYSQYLWNTHISLLIGTNVIIFLHLMLTWLNYFILPALCWWLWSESAQIARCMGPTWAHRGPTGPRWAHVGPMNLGWVRLMLCASAALC